MRRTYFITACLAWLIAMPIFGQVDLTPEQLKTMKLVGMQHVKGFEHDLNDFILNAQLSRRDRLERAETHTMKLFIDDQRTITVVDSHGRSSVRSLRDYFRRASMLSYTQTHVTSSEIYYGSKFQHDDRISQERGGDWYSATVVYRQTVTGLNGSEVRFSGSIEKVLTVFVQKMTNGDGVQTIDTYSALLGNCKVSETKSSNQ